MAVMIENIGVQTVREIPCWQKFEAKSKEGEKVRCVKDGDAERVFVFLKGKRSRGFHYSIPTFLAMYTPMIKTEEEENLQWHKKLATIEKRLEASGLWENIKEVVHNLQTMTKTEYDEFYQHADSFRANRDALDFSEPLKELTVKYPFLKAGEGVVSWRYTEDWIRTLKTKSMNFGTWHKSSSENIKRALAEKRSVTERGYTSYDVSYQYNAEKNRAWYSEEYRGCGNGHYYLALDSTMALFYEDD